MQLLAKTKQTGKPRNKAAGGASHYASQQQAASDVLACEQQQQQQHTCSIGNAIHFHQR
jgi:hypothetical protein